MRTSDTTILEPSRTVPVLGTYDVIVVGGGIAGVAAAVASARNGASVCLLEKSFGLGGLATLGNVVVWLPICDGHGRQVIAGLPEELLKLSVADLRQDRPAARFIGIPPCWQPGGDPAERKRVRYQVEFNPSAYLFGLERLLVESGVKLLYDTRVCAVQRESDRITHVIVENKSGRSAMACRVAVDATGDADLCALAGEETESLDTNVLASWFYSLRDGELRMHPLSNAYDPLGGKEGAKGPFFRGDNADQVTEFILGTRDLIRAKLSDLQAQYPDQDVQLVSPPALPSFRMTRRLAGSFSVNEKHRHVWLDDTVGLTGDWRKAGPVYPIPWRALRGDHSRNLLVAGRCISADKTVWDVTRAIPTCALTGAATGVASALAVRQGDGDVHSLKVDALQRALEDQGFLLDPGLVKPAAE